MASSARVSGLMVHRWKVRTISTSGDAAPRARCRLAAHAVIARADGLALHAVTTSGWIVGRQLTAATELVLDGLQLGQLHEAQPGQPAVHVLDNAELP
jgi:hypothetical protein